MNFKAGFLENIFENIYDGIAVTNSSDIIVYANSAIERITGIPAGKMTGKNILTDFPKVTKKELADTYLTTKKTKKPVSYEVKITTSENKDLWLRGLSIPRLDNGKFEGIITTIHDITLQKTLEISIKESEEKLHEAQEVAGIGSWTFNVETQQPKWTRQLFRIFGIDPQKGEPPYIDHKKYIHPDDWELFDTSVQNAIESGTGYNIEIRLIQPNGNLIWVNARCSAKKENGKVKYLTGTTQEITDRINILRELKKSKANYQLLVENQNDLVVKINRKKECLYINPNYCKIFEVDENKILGKTFIPLIHEDDRETVLNSIDSLQKPPHTAYHEERAMTKDGWRWFGWSLKGIKDTKNKIAEIIAVGRDITDQKNIENELRESEKKFKTIIEFTNDAIFLANQDGDYVYANNAASKMLGYSVDELLKLNVKDIGSQGPNGERFHKILTEGHLYDYFELKRKDGTIIKADLDAILLPNGLLYGRCRNITNDIERQIALKESEEKYRSTYDNAPLAFQSLNEEGFIKDINPTWLKTLGYKKDDIIGKWFGDFLHPDYVSHFRKNFPEFKKRGSISGVQFKLRKNDGSFLDVAFEGCIAYTPEGNFKQTYCTFKDITEAKQAEKALIESEEKFRALVENTGAGTGYYDLEGNIILFNTYAASLMGGVPDDFKGKNLIELYGEEAGKVYLKRIKKASVSETSHDYEDKIHLPSGLSWYLSTYTRIKNAEGNIIGVQVISKDISDRKKMEMELKDHKEKLEEKVKQRTVELEEKNKELEMKNKELEEYNQLFVGREFRIKELKDKIQELEKNVMDNTHKPQY